jgi:hypothetical protein
MGHPVVNMPRGLSCSAPPPQLKRKPPTTLDPLPSPSRGANLSIAICHDYASARLCSCSPPPPCFTFGHVPLFCLFSWSIYSVKMPEFLFFSCHTSIDSWRSLLSFRRLKFAFIPVCCFVLRNHYRLKCPVHMKHNVCLDGSYIVRSRCQMTTVQVMKTFAVVKPVMEMTSHITW